MTEPRPLNPFLKQTLELGPPLAFFAIYMAIRDDIFTIAGTDYSGFIVATLAFGEGWQTQTLRHFRDAVLRRRGWGRSIVYHYYRAGPRICAVLEASPALLGCMRWLLGQAAWLWRWWSREAGR